MSKRFTEGICGDGAAILDNGRPLTITEILNNLNRLEELEQLALCNVVDTLPADVLIKSLGEAKEPNEYILKTHNGVWWIEHKHVGSGEPLKQWLTDKPISG